jgi:hypothetical protein
MAIAGHTGTMTMDEARQMAIDFARLPELLKQGGLMPAKERGNLENVRNYFKLKVLFLSAHKCCQQPIALLGCRESLQ